MASIDHLWAVVLAAGDGSRLAELTRSLHGKPVPKQFAWLFPDSRSLLQTSLHYIRPVISSERMVVAVPGGKAELARDQLADFRGITIVEEPRNRGTAASLLLPLALVLERDPAASVLVVPAAYVLARPQALLEGVLLAHSSLDAAPLILLGVAANFADRNRPWIVPGRAITPGIRSMANLVMAPREEQARQLLTKRALWHPLLAVSEASTLWRISERHLAQQTDAIRAGVRAGTREALEQAYAAINPADFDRHVVARQLGVAVTDVTGCGFSDIVTPDDVLGLFPAIRERCAQFDRSDARRPPRQIVPSPGLATA